MAWDRLSALRSKGIGKGEILPALFNILKGNIAEVFARPVMEPRLAAVRKNVPNARLEFNARVAARRRDGTFESPKLFSDGLIVSEEAGQLRLHDAFEVKAGPGGGQEATSQFFEWREGRLKSGDQIVLSDGRRFTYAPGRIRSDQVHGMMTASPHIIAARGAEHLGIASGDQVGAEGTRTALDVSASEIDYLARLLLEALPQNASTPATGPAPGGANAP